MCYGIVVKVCSLSSKWDFIFIVIFIIIISICIYVYCITLCRLRKNFANVERRFNNKKIKKCNCNIGLVFFSIPKNPFRLSLIFQKYTQLHRKNRICHLYLDETYYYIV